MSRTVSVTTAGTRSTPPRCPGSGGTPAGAWTRPSPRPSSGIATIAGGGSRSSRGRAGLLTRLRVALDATPLYGAPTGVGVFTLGLAGALAARPDVAVSAFAATWRGRGRLPALLPDG